MTVRNDSSDLYAKWDEVEEEIYQQVLDFLLEDGYYGPESIARRIACDVMRRLDGYTAEDMAALSGDERK